MSPTHKLLVPEMTDTTIIARNMDIRDDDLVFFSMYMYCLYRKLVAKSLRNIETFPHIIEKCIEESAPKQSSIGF